LTRFNTGERFTVTTEPAASNGVSQSRFFGVANRFTFYALTASWLSMTTNASMGRFYNIEYRQIKSRVAEADALPSPPKPIGSEWGIPHDQLNV